MGMIADFFGRGTEGAEVKGYKSQEPNLADTVKLAGGESFYELFVPENPAGIIKPDEERQARQQAVYFAENYPELVRQCAGKTKEEAREIIQQAQQ